MYHSSSWNSEPYSQNQNPAEGRYCTLKSWTNTIMNRTGAPADCWLLCMIHASYILNHLSCEALDGNVPLSMLCGVSPDISILLLYTFYQLVFYATHNQSYPSVSEERAAHWVGFGEHVGGTLTHKFLMMTPRKSSTDLLLDLQILPIPTRDWYQMEKRAPRPPNPLSLSGLGKMIVNLLPHPWQNITLMTLLAGPSYSQRMNKEKGLEPESHQGPLSPQDENYKGSKYNVMVEWETGEITEDPLSLIATDDPVTCATYAKKHDLLHLDGWKRLKHIAKNQKQLTRVINQSKIRQVRRSAVYHFGFLIPKDYEQAPQLDEQNGNSKRNDATKLEMDQINEYKVFQEHGKVRLIPNRGRYQML